MKKLIACSTLFVLALAILAQAQENEGETRAKPEGMIDRASYSIGLNWGRNLARDGVKANGEMICQGIRDGLAEAESRLNPTELNEAMSEFQTKANEWRNEKAAASLKEGADFLAENGKRDGIQTLKSGLQYEVLTEGDGAKPRAVDQVSVHYEGSLISGTVFDSSYLRGEPATFAVRGVIAGWVEALQLMSVGSKWRLYIPSDLAYRDRGSGSLIGPNMVLIFEVELIEIIGR